MEKAVPPYTRKNPANGYYGQALDGRGEPITLTISRAWKYTSVTQDIVASELSQDSTLGNDYFFLFPMQMEKWCVNWRMHPKANSTR